MHVCVINLRLLCIRVGYENDVSLVPRLPSSGGGLSHWLFCCFCLPQRESVSVQRIGPAWGLYRCRRAVQVADARIHTCLVPALPLMLVLI